MSGRKNSIFAYFFAFIGGVFGLHHLYLARTQHALLWFTTFGGFGIGILYEILFKIRKYVGEVNNDDLVIEQYQKIMQERKSPAFELKRFFGKRKNDSKNIHYFFSKVNISSLFSMVL